MTNELREATMVHDEVQVVRRTNGRRASKNGAKRLVRMTTEIRIRWCKRKRDL